MRKIALSVTALAVFVPSVHAAPFEVLVKDDFFKPKLVTIKKDRKVRWIWKGSNPHNIAVRKPGGALAKRSVVKTSGTFTYTFRRTGTWKVVCEIHPDNMRMKVVVRRS